MKCRRCHGAGLLISMAIHVGALAAFLQHRGAALPPNPDRQVPVELSMFQEAPPAAVEAAAEPAPPPVPEMPPELPPPPPPEMEPPRPPPPRAERPKPARAPAPRRPAPVREEAAPAPAASAEPAPAAQPPPSPAEAEHLLAAYLQRLVAQLEQHKFYPEAARRRGQSGVVYVSFKLQRDGSVDELAANSPHPLLREAALAAVRQAAPLPAVPEKVHCPVPVRFGMEFNLN